MYHVNPATGEPGKCRAQIQCRFGNEAHFRTPEAARAHFEQVMTDVFLVNNDDLSDRAQAYTVVANKFLSTLTTQEQAAVEAYVNQDYAAINYALWNGETHELVSALDTALAKAPRKEKQLFRKPFLGYDQDEIQASLEKLKPGNAIDLHGYSSFSENPNVMAPLLHPDPRPSLFGEAEDQTEQNVVLTLHSAMGAPVSLLSHMPQEQEWLLPRGLTVLVKSVEKKTLETDHSILNERLPVPLHRTVTLVECELRTKP